MRISFLIIVGLVLGVAVIWYIAFVYQEIRGTGQIVIAPLTVIDSQGKANEELGKALAQMLNARLQSLSYELRDAQAGFTTNVGASVSAMSKGAALAPVGDVRLWTQSVALQTALLQPINLKLSVGGVDVGGVLPSIQRWLSRDRTLHFTLYSLETDVQIFGSLTALKSSDHGFRLHIKGLDGKAPTHDAIVDAIAHEVIHRYLSQDLNNRLEVLDPFEFMSLARVLVSVANANRNAILGRPAQKEYSALIPDITILADKVPEWPELGYLAARIADSSRDPKTALIYYQRARIQFGDGKQREIVDWIDTRISSLTSLSVEGMPTQVTSGGEIPVKSTAEPLPPAVDYSGDILFIRDMGREGSAVGMALATALEFQITKSTKKQEKVSARYIYYAARKAAGLDLTIDGGAYLKDGIAALSNQGAVTETVWPYLPGEFAQEPPESVEKAERFPITNARPVKTLDELKRALYANGPIVAGMTIFPSSFTDSVYKDGLIVLPHENEEASGGHAIVIVGYDDEVKRVKFANSWGSKWGDQGFGYLPYEYVRKYMHDAWTFTF